MTIRHAGDLPPRLTENLRRGVRRNFSVAVSAPEMERLIALYTAAYKYAVEELPRFLAPTDGRASSYDDLRKEPFLSHLAARYPGEPREVLETVAGYAFLYAYLM